MAWVSLVGIVSAFPAIETLLLAGLLILLTREYFGDLLSVFQYPFWQRVPRLLVTSKAMLVLFFFFTVAKGMVGSIVQYAIWQEGITSKFLLPPYQPMHYFLSYAWQHFWKGPTIAVILGGVIFLVLETATFFAKGRLFYDEEPYIAGSAILALGWPTSLFVVGGTFMLGLLVQIVLLLRSVFWEKPFVRVPLIHFWLPLALFAIFFGAIIKKWLGLDQFKL